MFTKETQELAKATAEAIKKISKGKWEWEPEMGEWCIWQDKVYVIYEVEENIGEIIQMKDTRIAAPYDFHYVMRKSLTPLLHWERILSILKTFGFKSTVTTEDGWAHIHFFDSDERCVKTQDGFTQPSVMRAVIELGKESSNEKD